jgi:hypothetical protein
MSLDIKAIGQAILNSAIKIMFPLAERFVLNSRDQALAAAECHHRPKWRRYRYVK